MSFDAKRAGRIGGFQTVLRHGSSHMAEIGRLGGRPRVKTISELGQNSASEAKLDNKEDCLPTQLVQLKELYGLRNKQEGS